MLKLIILCVAIYIAYKLFANDFIKRRVKSDEVEKAENERRAAAGEMVKDPECGTYVAVDDSLSIRDGGQTWYFCSYECRDKFLHKLQASGRHPVSTDPD